MSKVENIVEFEGRFIDSRVGRPYDYAVLTFFVDDDEPWVQYSGTRERADKIASGLRSQVAKVKAGKAIKGNPEFYRGIERIEVVEVVQRLVQPRRRPAARPKAAEPFAINGETILALAAEAAKADRN